MIYEDRIVKDLDEGLSSPFVDSLSSDVKASRHTLKVLLRKVRKVGEVE